MILRIAMARDYQARNGKRTGHRSGFVAVDRDNRLAALGCLGAEHELGAEGPCDFAVRSDYNDAAMAAEVTETMLYHLIDRRLKRHMPILHQRADLTRRREAYEMLTAAGRGRSARLVRSIGARADDWTVADSAPALRGRAAGRRPGCNMTGGIACHGADSAVTMGLRL